jgi:hyperosmotically inducible protein
MCRDQAYSPSSHFDATHAAPAADSPLSNLENTDMTRNQTIVGACTVLALVWASASIRAASATSLLAQENKVEQGAEKTKDAVVKGAQITGEKTKEVLSKSGEVITDAWITTRVHARFVDEPLLKNSDISVDADKHIVTLKGTVPTTAGRTKAARIARGTEGVRSVVNHLRVGPKTAS